MIKTIKKIDVYGNEIWQEVFVCDRCKNPIEQSEYVYEIKWTGWYPVKMEPGHAYGFSSDGNPTRHICESCQQKIEKFITGQLDNEVESDVTSGFICPYAVQHNQK